MGGISLERIKCIGCGIKIQTENPKMEGYAPPASLEKEEVDLQTLFPTAEL